MLAGEPGVEVVGEAGDGLEAVDAAARLQPDVVLLDVRMPRCSGLQAAPRILEVAPRCRILMLTLSDEPGHRATALAAGAVGYLLKESSIADVVEAVEAAHAMAGRRA